MKINGITREIMWIQNALRIDSAKINAIDEKIGISKFVRAPLAHKEAVRNLTGEAAYNRITMSAPDFKPIDDMIATLERKGYGAISSHDPEYPETLRNIYSYPPILYYKGDIGLLKTRCLGVVGTREPSRYGRDYTQKFVEVLSKCSLTIVSGMARGVDGIAHTTALNNGGKTIAVLGTGIDTIFPKEHVELYKRICEEGLVITEFLPGTPALAYNFPVRNRIISGLSEGVLVTEAGEKSGSLITADYAIRQGRDLFVIPSALNSPRGAGGNRLLKTCQGAIVLSPDDIADAMGISRTPERRASAMQLDFMEEKIVEALTYSEIHFDDLIELTGLGVSDLNALLVRMELIGLIKKLDNNYYGV